MDILWIRFNLVFFPQKDLYLDELDKLNKAWSKLNLKLSTNTVDSVVYCLQQLRCDQGILGSNPSFAKILSVQFIYLDEECWKKTI